MIDAKYIGLDVHQATISVAVLDSAGSLVMEAILETKAETILQFIHGLGGSLHVTFPVPHTPRAKRAKRCLHAPAEKKASHAGVWSLGVT